jgi:hypothetical protein
MTTITHFDPEDLEIKVKAMYRSVAGNPRDCGSSRSKTIRPANSFPTMPAVLARSAE